jgi:hypothetical protein
VYAILIRMGMRHRLPVETTLVLVVTQNTNSSANVRHHLAHPFLYVLPVETTLVLVVTQNTNSSANVRHHLAHPFLYVLTEFNFSDINRESIRQVRRKYRNRSKTYSTGRRECMFLFIFLNNKCWIYF